MVLGSACNRTAVHVHLQQVTPAKVLNGILRPGMAVCLLLCAVGGRREYIGHVLPWQAFSKRNGQRHTIIDILNQCGLARLYRVQSERVCPLFYFSGKAIGSIRFMHFFRDLAFEQDLPYLLHRQYLEGENGDKNICQPLPHFCKLTIFNSYWFSASCLIIC